LLPPSIQFGKFKPTLAAHPHTLAQYMSYFHDNPVMANQSVAAMGAYVHVHLRSTPAPVSATFAGSAVSAPIVHSGPVTHSELREILSAFAGAAAVRPKAASRPPRSGRGAGRAGRGPPPRAYCYVHGTCAHAGVSCRLMLADPTTYTQAMLSAPPGAPGGAPE